MRKGKREVVGQNAENSQNGSPPMLTPNKNLSSPICSAITRSFSETVGLTTCNCVPTFSTPLSCVPSRPMRCSKVMKSFSCRDLFFSQSRQVHLPGLGPTGPRQRPWSSAAHFGRRRFGWCKYKHNVKRCNRRKFRSQTSDNMGRWKAEMGRVREEKRRRKKIKKEKVSEERRSRCAKR